MPAPSPQSALRLTTTIVKLRETQQALADAKDACAAHSRDISILDALILKAAREKDVAENAVRSFLSVLSDLNSRNAALRESTLLHGAELKNAELHRVNLETQSEMLVGNLGTLEEDIIELEARRQELFVQVQNARREVRDKQEAAQERRRVWGAAKLELGRAKGQDDRTKMDGAQLAAILD